MRKNTGISVILTIILISVSAVYVPAFASPDVSCQLFGNQSMMFNSEQTALEYGFMVQSVDGLEIEELAEMDEVQELTDLLHWFMDGASRNDRAVHDTFWNENLVYTSSAGTRFGKADIMSGFDDTRNLREVGPTTQYSAHDITVRIFGAQQDVAVVSFRMKGETLTMQGTTTSWYLNSGTLIKIEGKWSVVNWQATRVP